MGSLGNGIPNSASSRTLPSLKERLLATVDCMRHIASTKQQVLHEDIDLGRGNYAVLAKAV